jgi:hypothetical protein
MFHGSARSEIGELACRAIGKLACRAIGKLACRGQNWNGPTKRKAQLPG